MINYVKSLGEIYQQSSDIATALKHSGNTVEQLVSYCCLGGAAVWCRTRDRKVAGSTPSWGAIKSTRSTQPSIPPG